MEYFPAEAMLEAVRCRFLPAGVRLAVWALLFKVLGDTEREGGREGGREREREREVGGRLCV